MKKTLVFILIIFSLLTLTIRFGYKPLAKALGYQDKAGIKITSTPEEATVLINGKEVGKTPYQNEDLKAGDYEVKLFLGDALWQSQVKLTSGTLSVVNRELGLNTASSSGEVLVLNPGQGVVITSVPDLAEVEIDGQVYGKTPLIIPDLASGEHTFILSRDVYLKRSIRAVLPKGLLLHLDVDLALSELSSSNTESILQKVSLEQKLIVKKTPTGFLRVRNKPSLNGLEVGRVNTGDNLTIEEELSGWFKIKMDNGNEGYISAAYAQKQ